MAKVTIASLVDDLDGSEAVESIALAYRGIEYTIDVSEKNSAAFDRAMAKWLQHATAQRQPTRSSRNGGAPARRKDLAAVRTWAAANGWDVSARGRVAAEVLAAYDAAHRR